MIEDIFSFNKKTTHGSSAFASTWEVRKLLKSGNKGVYLANGLRLTSDKSFMHTVLVGPSGSHKSTGFLLNNLLRKWNQSVGMVIFDPDGSGYEKCTPFMENEGFQVLKIDLNNPEESESTNPLLEVTDKHSAREMAQTLIEGVYKDNKSDPFWSESGQLLLMVVILAMTKRVPESERTLSFLAHLINKFNPTSQEEVDAFIEGALEDDLHTFQEYLAFTANSFKVKMSILATIKACLYSFADPVMQRICSHNSFSFSKLREGKIALFLIQREDRISYNRTYWALFLNSLFSYLMQGGSSSQPVYCFLEEFSSYKIPNFTAIISTIRRRNVGLNIILQSVESLREIYGPEQAKVVFENCATKMFLSGLSYESSKLVSDMLGQGTATYSQEPLKGLFTNDTPRYRTARPLLTPDEVRRLKDGTALVVHRNHRPMLLKQTPYFKNRKLKRRSK